MTPLQRLQLKQSETRQRLNELLGKDEISDDERGELATLTTRAQELEVELRAAVVASADPTVTPTDDTATRELRELERGASIADIFAATIEHRSTDGQTAELQQHLRLTPNQVPLALLRDMDRVPMETRTTGVTPAPANVAAQQAEIIPAVFPMACATFLGVDMPTVGVGDAVYPVLTTSATAGTPAEGAEHAHSTGAFTSELLAPSRIQASFFYTREDRARFAGMDSALRMNLEDALSDQLDRQVLVGTEGLFTGANLANNNVNALTTYALYRDHLAYGRVDGTYAGTVADLRIVMGSESYAHAAKQFRSDNAGDRAALEDLEAVTGGVKVSAHVPDAANDKQNAIVRLGMRRDMVVPIWEGVTLIPDEVTKASSGEIVVTAVMLHAVKILRAAGFYKQQLQHA